MLDRTTIYRSPAQAVIEEECAKAGVTLAALRIDIRFAKYTEARRAIARRLRLELKLPYQTIGRLLDRDHTSIQSLVKGTAKERHRRLYVPKKKRVSA